MIKYTDQRDPFTIKEIHEMIEFEQEIRPPDIYPESDLAALCREWLKLKEYLDKELRLMDGKIVRNFI